jgi:hypothetical protein
MAGLLVSPGDPALIFFIRLKQVMPNANQAAENLVQKRTKEIRLSVFLVFVHHLYIICTLKRINNLLILKDWQGTE